MKLLIISQLILQNLLLFVLLFLFLEKTKTLKNNKYIKKAIKKISKIDNSVIVRDETKIAELEKQKEIKENEKELRKKYNLDV